MAKDISDPKNGGKLTRYESAENQPKVTVLRPHRGDVPQDRHTNHGKGNFSS